MNEDESVALAGKDIMRWDIAACDYNSRSSELESVSG